MPEVTINNVTLNNPVCSVTIAVPTGIIISITDISNSVSYLSIQSPNE